MRFALCGGQRGWEQPPRRTAPYDRRGDVYALALSRALAMRYVFGDCVLDTERYLLHRAGQPIRLRPKVFRLLIYLITQRERVIPKQELSERVWNGRFISDATLESTLAALRRVLGDRGRDHRYIHTLHGHGYRFVAPVEERADPRPDAVGDARRSTAEALAGSARDGPQTATVATPPTTAGVRPAGLPLAGAAGAPRASEERSPPAFELPPNAGERKLVSVLCCALSPTPEPRDPEDLDMLHQQVVALYELVQHEAQQCGGAIQPVTGERVLVVFGLPAAQEDHAQRAALAALGLQDRIQQLLTAGGRTPVPWLHVRMAVHTGPVAVGGLNGAAATAVAVVGETMTQAMALQAAASPGVLLCSAATARLVRGLVRLEATAPKVGMSLPSPVYQILGRRSRRAPIGRRGGRRLSPFVGRHQELATLQAVLAQAEAGRGQVVGIVGEPGLGKLRLLFEFRHSVRQRRLLYLAADCLSYTQAMPYGPVRELLRHYCTITADDPPATIRAKVQRSLEQLEIASEEAVPYLLQLLEVPGEPALTGTHSPQAVRARTVASLVELALMGARRRPLVLEVENLQWLDPSSEEVLTALVERLAGAAILLLVSYRPGYQLPWLDKSYVTQVALSPLAAADSRRVVQANLRTGLVVEAMVQALLVKAQGNPFFLEELARAVAEHDTAQVSPSGVPETVQAVLAARIDRLSPETKRLLQVAAVIGKDVAVPLLQAVSDLPEEVLYAQIAQLQAREFLYETVLEGMPAYTFTHALTQLVAYGSVLWEQRRVLHRRIVEAIEALVPNPPADHVERLAHHALWGSAISTSTRETWRPPSAY